MHLHLIFIIIKKYGKEITKVFKGDKADLEQIFDRDRLAESDVDVPCKSGFIWMGEVDVKNTRSR